MDDLISRKDAIDAIENSEFGYTYEVDTALDVIKSLPSAEPEIITIEELSNQLGCATIQSAFYWFEFLKTLDSLGFAIIRKETR